VKNSNIDSRTRKLCGKKFPIFAEMQKVGQGLFAMVIEDRVCDKSGSKEQNKSIPGGFKPS
jgi:hypothetical protein